MLALELSLFNLYSFLNQNNVDNNCPPLPREETSAKLRVERVKNHIFFTLRW